MARPTVAELLKRIETLEAELAILRAQHPATPVYHYCPSYPVAPWQITCGSPA